MALLTRMENLVVGLSVVLALACLLLVWLTTVTLRQRREIARLEERASRSVTGSRAKVAAGWAVRTALDTATRVRQRGFFEGVLMAPIEDLVRLSGEDPEAIEAVRARDGTVTVLFSDIESSTQLNEELGDKAFVKLLGEHDRLVRREVERHDGRVVKSQGDGFMVVFGSPADAVAAATTIHRKVGEGRRARRSPVRVRIGINCGRVVSRDGDYFGRNVAMAARIAALADGGQTLVSEHVAAGLDDDVALDHVGAVELRGLTGEHDVYAVAT